MANSRRPTTDRIGLHLLQNVPIDFLIFYRIAFGLVMCWWAVDNLRHGIPYESYASPVFHFTYYGFEWIRPIDLSLSISGVTIDGMSILFIAFAGLACCIALGLWYRIASILFGVGYVYWFMLDKAYYLNHYYLCSILSLMMPLLPANRAFSLDVWIDPAKRRDTSPAWVLWLLRFQIGVPYFFGGIAKINADWLRGQPMRTALAHMQDHPWVARFPLEQESLVQIVCWGGLLFDLTIVPLLLYRRTRLIAFLLACLFHFSNHNLWNIGIFPWLMMAATSVYLDPGWPRKLMLRFNLADSPKSPQSPPTMDLNWKQRVLVSCFGFWIFIQVLVPLRVFVLPGNPSWSEYTHHFSWHMLLRAKVSGLRIYATDPTTGQCGTIDLRQYLTPRQLSVVGRDPHMIHQLCLFISENLALKGSPGVELRALALVALNGRKPQPIIDPSVNLAAEPRNLSYPAWIVDLYEPYRHDAWLYALHEWERRLDLDLPPQMTVVQTEANPNSPQKSRASQ